MNYQKHYDNLIRTRKNRILEEGVYYEKHHIVMRSMGGSNSKDNIVYLTAREHFIAHWLLWRIHKNKQTAAAFYCMQRFISNNQSRYITNSRIFEEAKQAKFSPEYRKILSERFKGHKINLGRTFVMSEEQKEKIRNSLKGRKASEETRLKMSKAHLGKPKGRKHD